MRKLIFLILFASVTTGAVAQLSAGIKGGINFSKLESDFLTTDSEIGYYGGIFGTWEVTDMFAFQPEVYLTHQAGNNDGFEYSFNYLAVPALVRIKVRPIHIYIGGHFGFLMSVDAFGVDKEDFKGVAVSGVLGAGYEIPQGIELGGRYVHGLSDISNNEFIQDVHFRMWEIYLAWRIIKSKK